MPSRGHQEVIKRSSRGHQEAIKRQSQCMRAPVPHAPSRCPPPLAIRGNQEAITMHARTCPTRSESVPTPTRTTNGTFTLAV